ncbi:CPBP family intramembrane metalloprotease [bacterium]|nr:CPBP family intramembrane metalloprotease [bacterium]
MQKKPLIKWGWLRAVIGLVVLFCTMGISEYVARPVLKILGWQDRLGFVVISLLLLFGVFYLLKFFMDGQSLKTAGFSLKRMAPDIVFSIVLSFSIMGGLFLILNLSGLLIIKGIHFKIQPILYWLAVLFMYSAIEEIPLRGYVLPNLAKSVNPYLAVVIISVFFGLLHAGNQNVTVIGVINCALLGMLAGLYYIYKENLWFPIIFHLFWNYFMGIIFGVPISGKTFDYQMLVTEIRGPDWLSGGSFGFEGSVILSVISIGAIVFLYYRYRKPARVSL